MKIDIVNNDNELIVKLEGRLDTNTVTDLESKMPNLESIKKIVFDLDTLEYISSAGLRFILKCKKRVDNTKVINANANVYEVFNVTGFSQMMDVEKGLRKITVDDSELIGEGFYGKIYKLDPETIVKVYKIPDALDMIKSETELAKKAFVMGLPTAIPYDIVRVGDLYGAVFELLNAEPFEKNFENEEYLDDFCKKCALILKDIHKKEIKEGELPSKKEITIKQLKELESCFSKETYDKLLKLIESIPEKNTLLHSDFHFKNVMAQGDELLIIDMATLSTGHPIFEFAAMHAAYEAFSCVDKENTVKFFNLPLSITKKLFDKIFRYYYDDKTEEELKDMEMKLSIISYLKVLLMRYKYANMAYGMEKEEVEFCKKYLTETASKLDTLDF